MSDTLLQSTESIVPTSSYDSDSGFLDSLKNINMTTWLIIILILAFLGFNIFAYLAKGTEDVKNFFAPLMTKLFGATVEVAGQTIDVSAEGAKAVVNDTAGAITSGLTAVQNVTPNNVSSSIKGQSIEQPQQPDVGSLNRALNTAQQRQITQNDYEPNDASDSVHVAGKAGWCYIGNDKGFRTCAQVGVNDFCMSGDIFPTQEICVNPNLRK